MGASFVAAEEANKASSTRATSNEVTQTLPTPVVLNPTVPFVAIPPGGLAGPATMLNIGMDYRGGPAPISAVRGKLPAAPSTALLVPSSLEGSRDRGPPDPSIQVASSDNVSPPFLSCSVSFIFS